MLSQKERDFQPCVVSLETLVRDLVQHLYKPFGRPGIDPVVFFKLQLIMFFEGIRSERQLMNMVAMRLDCRWYIAYDLHENVPDHSSLTYIRNRCFEWGVSAKQETGIKYAIITITSQCTQLCLMLLSCRR